MELSILEDQELCLKQSLILNFAFFPSDLSYYESLSHQLFNYIVVSI